MSTESGHSAFLQAVQRRRSYYNITAASPIPDAAIQDIVKTALTCCPSAFNAQSARAVLLLGDEHLALWQIVKDTLQKIVPADRFGRTEQKLATFAAGYGSILFFEDQQKHRSLQEKYPSYSDNVTPWSLQASGMLQFIVWTALEEAGFGASLQHYNPLIDAAVRQRWGLPEHWMLLSQMPFGVPSAQPGDKQIDPLDHRFKVFPA